MKKLTEIFGNITPPAVTTFSDSTFYYLLGAAGIANVPVPPGAVYVDITASQFVAVSPASISGAPATSPVKTAGSQSIIFSQAVTSGGATGLKNDSTMYTATFYVDGGVIPWFEIGSNLQTFGAIISSFNSALNGAATAAITSGQIVVTSATTGVNSQVAISAAPVVTPTPSATPTISVTGSTTRTPTGTAAVSPTISSTPTNTRTPSVTPSVTDSPGITVTPSVSPTHTGTPTTTPTAAITHTVTPTISTTPSLTPTISVTHSVSPTISVTPSQVGSGVFPSLPLFSSFGPAVAGALTSSNAAVVLTIIKELNNVSGAPVTTIGVYAPTAGTQVSLEFYK